MWRSSHGCLLAGLGLFALACGAEAPPAWDPVPHLGPPLSVQTPDPALVELGRGLFHEPRLSGNRTQSCASCHEQALGFAQARALPPGSTGQSAPRNAPGLANLAWARALTWSNPVLDTLQTQARVPLFGDAPVELGLEQVDERLAELGSDPWYAPRVQRALGRPLDVPGLLDALAAFQRTLISASSPYDDYLRGDADALDTQQRLGLQLFRQYGCADCHAGPLLSAAFDPESGRSPFANNGLAPASELVAPNAGLVEFTLDEADRGRFRIPSLRNVALTAPYMHDGRLQTLEEVLDHYAAGPVPGATADPPVAPLTMSAGQRAALKAFFGALTDTAFVEQPAFSDPH